jgi:hypothetical protein
MDGIQTRVYCPECGAEVELLLEKLEISEHLRRMVKMLNLPSSGDENAYMGKVKCSCGKTIRATFVYDVFSESERPQEVITSGEII